MYSVYTEAYIHTSRQCATLKGKNITKDNILNYGTLKGRCGEVCEQMSNETAPPPQRAPELQEPPLRPPQEAEEQEVPKAEEKAPTCKAKEAIDATIKFIVEDSVFLFVMEKTWQANSATLQNIGAYQAAPTYSKRRLWKFSCAQDNDFDTCVVRYKRGESEGMRLSNAPFQIIPVFPKESFETFAKMFKDAAGPHDVILTLDCKGTKWANKAWAKEFCHGGHPVEVKR